MEIKIIFSAISVIIGIWAFFPYFKDIILKQTTPHVFTWLIWIITQGTATAGIWFGNGGVGAIGLTTGTFLVVIIFFMSLRNGKKDITKSDIVVLAIALSAIMIWWLLNNPVLAVLLVSVINVIGFIPTFRKSYNHPWTETALTWGSFVVANIFAVLALESYNLLTLSYLISISLADMALLIFLLIRRRHIPKPLPVLSRD